MGTVLQKAFKAVGITEDRVQRIFGACKCKTRAHKLNQLSDWAWGIVRGVVERGSKELTEEEKRNAENHFKKIEGAP
jgi:hypothetical protein